MIEESERGGAAVERIPHASYTSIRAGDPRTITIYCTPGRNARRWGSYTLGLLAGMLECFGQVRGIKERPEQKAGLESNIPR